jgi:hypothetical protein
MTIVVISFSTFPKFETLHVLILFVLFANVKMTTLTFPKQYRNIPTRDQIIANQQSQVQYHADPVLASRVAIRTECEEIGHVVCRRLLYVQSTVALATLQSKGIEILSHVGLVSDTENADPLHGMWGC